MPQPRIANRVSLATQRMTDALFYVVADGSGGVVMVPKPAMQATLDNHFARLNFRDAKPAQNNLGRGGKPGFLPGDWNRNNVSDQSATGSQGSPGTAGGGTPRRSERPPKPPSLRPGQFSVDGSAPGGTAFQAEHPYRPYGTRADERTGSDDQIPTDTATPRPLSSPMSSTTATPNVIDQEDDPDGDLGLGTVVAQLPDPGMGMTYRLSRAEDGSIAIVICEDDGEGLDMNDATYRHKLTGDAAFFKRLNGIHRRRWSRTKDANSTQMTTLFRHRGLAKGERLELQQDAMGHSLVLFSPTTPNMNGDPPPATSTQWRNRPPTAIAPTGSWNAQAPDDDHGDELSIHELVDPVKPARTGDRIPLRGSEAHRLAQMNAQAREFWAAKR
jgi:hypothetical protein